MILHIRVSSILILFSFFKIHLLTEILLSSEFDTNNFQNSVWTIYPTSSSYISDCGPYQLVGGVDIFGQGAFMSKYVTGLLPHYALNFQLFLMTIDNWGASDAFQIVVDSQIIYQFIPANNPQDSFSSSQCGSASFNDSSIQIDFNLTHNSSQFLVKLTSNLQKPASQASWGISQLNISYFSCDITCNTCSDFFSYSCTSCYNLAILSQGMCQCSAGYYLNIPSLICTQMPCLYCSPCFSTCQTCANSSYQDCLTCIANLYLEPSGECSVVCISPFITDSVNMTCISPCSSNQYVDKSTRACETCSSSCLTCFGPLTTNCLSCSAESNTFLDYKTCVPQCPDGQYADLGSRKCLINCNSLGESEDLITQQCEPFQCDSSCLTCRFPNATFCLSCDSGEILVNNSCLNLVCDSSCLTCSGFEANECLSCLAPTILKNGQCLDCDPSCLTCNDTTINNCTSCLSSKLFINGQCIDCSAPMIVYNGSCMSCDPSCQTCNGPSNSNCLTCYAPKLIRNSQCVDLVCDPSCQTCYGFNSNECLSCSSPIILVNNSCIPCNAACLTCNGPLVNNCLTCYSPKMLKVNQCLDLICDSSCLTCNGFYANNCLTCNSSSFFINSQCFTCDVSCLACSGSTIYNCTSCVLSKLFINGQCIDCSAPMIVYNGSCMSCDPSCQTCNGPSNSNCLTCYSTKLIRNSQCVDLVCDPSCQTCYGFNSNECLSCSSPTILVNNSCMPCNAACLTCNGPLVNNCLTCYSPKMLKVNQCLDLICDSSCLTCNGFYANNCLSCNSSSFLINSQCFSCDVSCLTCSGSTIYNCTSCVLSKLLRNGQCIDCPAPMIVYNGTCMSCDPSCQTCNGPSNSNCLSCYPPKLLNISKCANLVCDQNCQTCFGFNSQQCLSCYPPKILLNNVCVPCDSNCLTCNGTLSNNCLSCYAPKLLRYSQCLDLVCDPSCLTCNGFDPNNCLSCVSSSSLLNSQCFPCDMTCLTCFGLSQYNCLTCPNNKLLTQDNQCLELVCDPSCLTCYGFQADQCLSCDSSMVLINGSCFDCDPSCLGCSDIYSNSCIICYENSYLTNSSQCELYICDESCEDCIGTTLLDCLICKDPRVFMINDLCLFKSNCLENTYWNQSTKSCTQFCTSPYWQLPQFSNCITDCPPIGYYSDSVNRICLKCNDNCQQCDENLVCLQCFPGFFYDEDGCVQFCPENKYSDTNYVCQYCYQDCFDCSSYGENQCLSCKSPKYFDGLQFSCVENCSGSQYGNYQNSRCSQCHSDCIQCFGPDSNNCLSCMSGKYLLDSFNECVDECPDYTVVDEENKICKTCAVENCSLCEDSNPLTCSKCDEAFFLDLTQTIQCLPMILVNVDVELVYEPVVFRITFDQAWGDLFAILKDSNKSKSFVDVIVNDNSTSKSRRLLNDSNFNFVIVADDLNFLSFFINFTFLEDFSTSQELILIINYTSPPPPQYKLKENNFSLTAASYSKCKDNTQQYYSALYKTCLNKIALNPLINIDYDNSLKVFLYFSDDSVQSNITLQNLIVNAINVSIDVSNQDYSYAITHTTKDFYITITFKESEIGKPLLTLWLESEKLPILILLNPVFNIYGKSFATLLPTYILSESTQKTINSSSNATSIADIATQATVIVNTILNSGSSFVVRGLMLTQYIYSLAYINIQFPPNVVELFKSQQSIKTFDLPNMEILPDDLIPLPEVFLIYKKSPFFIDNFGVNVIQILGILLVGILLKLMFDLIPSLKKIGALNALRFFFNWNFFIIYTFTQINKLTIFVTMNLKYHSFETFNGRVNFMLSFFCLLFEFGFLTHIFIITYTLKKYDLEAKLPLKPESPKKLNLSQIKTLLIEDEYHNIVEISVETLNKGLKSIKEVKKNKVFPFPKIEESKKEEESPEKETQPKRITIIENMLASQKPKPKIKQKRDLDKIPTQVPLDSQKELEFFEEEKKKYFQSLGELNPEEKTKEENPKTQILLQRDNIIDSGSYFINKNKEKNEENKEKVNETKSYIDFARLQSDEQLLSSEQRPIIRLADLVMEGKGPKEKLNLWKHPTLLKVVATMNKERMKKSRNFFQKMYDFFYVPKDLKSYQNQYSILHKDIKQNNFFQTYFIALDLFRHVFMCFLLIMLLENGIETILVLFVGNGLFLAILIKYRPIKTNFFMNFAIVNEIIINTTFAMTLALGILDQVDDTGYIDSRVNFGWGFVFSALALLYFLIFMTVMRFVRILFINLKSMIKNIFLSQEQNMIENTSKKSSVFINNIQILEKLRKTAPEHFKDMEMKELTQSNERTPDKRGSHFEDCDNRKYKGNKIHPETFKGNKKNEEPLSNEESHIVYNKSQSIEVKSLDIVSLKSLSEKQGKNESLLENKLPENLFIEREKDKNITKPADEIRKKRFFNDRTGTILETGNPQKKTRKSKTQAQIDFPKEKQKELEDNNMAP